MVSIKKEKVKKVSDKHFKEKSLSKNAFFIATIVLAVFLLVLVICLVELGSNPKTISVKEAEKMVKDFATAQGLVIESCNTTIESGVYAITPTIGGNVYSPMYITTDGKYVVYGALYDFDQLLTEYENQQNTGTTGSTE